MPEGTPIFTQGLALQLPLSIRIQVRHRPNSLEAAHRVGHRPTKRLHWSADLQLPSKIGHTCFTGTGFEFKDAFGEISMDFLSWGEISMHFGINSGWLASCWLEILVVIVPFSKAALLRCTKVSSTTNTSGSSPTLLCARLYHPRRGIKLSSCNKRKHIISNKGPFSKKCLKKSNYQIFIIKLTYLTWEGNNYKAASLCGNRL